VRASDQLAATRPDDHPTIQGNGIGGIASAAPLRVASRPPMPRPATPRPIQPRPMMPPPLTPPPRTRMAPPQEPKGPKRGNAGLIATVSVVVLLVVVAGILATTMLNRSHGSNTATNRPASNTTGANQAGDNSGPVPTVDYTQMRAELINYYTLLPNDTQDAWNYLAPDFRPRTTFADFQKFYAGMNAVSVKNILPASGDTVDATITFVRSGGVTTHERYRFTFERGQDRLLIVSGIRLGSA
jgi:serine/threonine-protein kinase